MCAPSGLSWKLRAATSLACLLRDRVDPAVPSPEPICRTSALVLKADVDQNGHG
jgi:hypothetical protein